VPSPLSSAVVSCCGILVLHVWKHVSKCPNNVASKGEPDCKGEKAPEWSAFTQRSNWILVFIGGITAYAIWKQTQAATNAAQATQKSAEATEKSVKLQEVALRRAARITLAKCRSFIAWEYRRRARKTSIRGAVPETSVKSKTSVLGSIQLSKCACAAMT
jgi:hypothetical protein